MHREFKDGKLVISDLERLYVSSHISDVLAEINANFSGYFNTFSQIRNLEVEKLAMQTSFKVLESKPSKKKINQNLVDVFKSPVQSYFKEQPKYQEFFEIEGLEEYEDDPNSFSKDMTRECPIIRRCVNSPLEEMRRYREHFYNKSGRELLDVCKNIIEFGIDYDEHFQKTEYEGIKTVETLGLSELLEERYISYQAIGTGIKSHFLYCLYPYAFPNESQNSVWALFYLTNKKNFGYKDDSEFLMVDLDSNTTSQNYHYPYDVFGYYALKLYLLLKEACAKYDYHFEDDKRYIYLNAFFDHICENHRQEITEYKRNVDYNE